MAKKVCQSSENILNFGKNYLHFNMDFLETNTTYSMNFEYMLALKSGMTSGN